ncbi:MAG: CaiB/BaiF CoA-transferase family protein [Roseicyclus sp.]
MTSSGPLHDIRVVELAAQGPGPFAGGLLADFGADVVIIDRPPGLTPPPGPPRSHDAYNRNKRSIALDLKSETGRTMALSLIAKADIFIEGYRPGVAERLGLGPAECHARNPSLVYGRMTGWGQDGPLAQEAGHDINYLALTGALGSIGAPGTPPPPPLNLVADLGGGAMYLAFGLMAALMEVRRSGRGQVVDAAMIDGVAHLMSMFQSFRQLGTWSDRREDNIIDGGAPFYGSYETRDGKYVAVGAIEPQFWTSLLTIVGLDPATMPDQMDREAWPGVRARLAAAFRARDRDEWTATAAGRDACLSPILTMDEAWVHPQMTARGTFADFHGLKHPNPAPRLSETPGNLRRPSPDAGAHGDEILRDWGIDSEVPQ